jgi:hypothetical protein
MACTATGNRMPWPAQFAVLAVLRIRLTDIVKG